MKSYPYQISPLRVLPFFRFLVRRSFAVWVAAAGGVAVVYGAFWGLEGAVAAVALALLGYLALLGGIWVAFVRQRARIETDAQRLSLLAGTYEKHIPWAEIEAISERQSLVWSHLLHVRGRDQEMTINLPLVREAPELLAEVKARIPASARVDGTWSRIARGAGG